MPTAFEEITLTYKVISLIFEIGRAIRNEVKTLGHSKFRYVSSLTTIEFVEADESPTAYFVQDRTVKITENDVHMPPFQFGTAGRDELDGITVTTVDHKTNHYNHRVVETNGYLKTIGIDAERVFARNEMLRSVFTAISYGGFSKQQENFRTTVSVPTETSTVVIIFPKRRPPQELETTYRLSDDPAGQWRPVKREKNELRQFTGGRKAFVLEAKNPPIGNEYKIAWKW